MGLYKNIRDNGGGRGRRGTLAVERSAYGSLLSVGVTGIAETVEALAKFKNSLASRVLRRSVEAGSRVLRKSVRATTPRDTGWLKKNVSYKVKAWANGPSGPTAWAAVGIRSGAKAMLVPKKRRYARATKRRAAARLRGETVGKRNKQGAKYNRGRISIKLRKPRLYWATKYAHLVEWGNKFGAPAQRFIERGFNAGRDAAFRATAEMLKKLVMLEVERAAVRGRIAELKAVRQKIMGEAA